MAKANAVSNMLSKPLEIVDSSNSLETLQVAVDRLAEEGNVDALATLFEMFLAAKDVVMGYWSYPVIEDNKTAEPLAEAEADRFHQFGFGRFGKRQRDADRRCQLQ